MVNMVVYGDWFLKWICFVFCENYDMDLFCDCDFFFYDFWIWLGLVECRILKK